jgi:CHAT domain-containing protein
LDISENALIEQHRDVMAIENEYAYVLLKTDRIAQAVSLLKRNYQKIAQEVAENFEWLTDNQKESYWKKEAVFFDRIAWMAQLAHTQTPEVTDLNYNSALLTKSKLLEVKISSENYYRELEEIREQLAYTRRLSAKMESDGTSDRAKLIQLRKEADSLDKRLTVSWPEYAQQKKNLSITWEQVQQNLSTDEAAIEFVRFLNEDDSLYYYNALLLRKGDVHPLLVSLCREKDVTSIQPRAGFSSLYRLVWEPLEPFLKSIKTIYYAPVGVLTAIPFGALYAPSGQGDMVSEVKADKRGVVGSTVEVQAEKDAVFLMDRFQLHQLTSTRYLAMGIRLKEKEPIGKSLAMLGGVDYDFLPGGQSGTILTKDKKKGSGNRSSESASGRLSFLPGTKAEMEEIASEMTKENWPVSILQDTSAREENVVKMENKEAKSILHLATHGYAFPEFNYKDTSIKQQSLRYSFRYSTNPMVRSGLILAGGNWAWTGSDTLTKLGAEQNGILTALEVSQLNLKKTKLVVLSACETGLGTIDGAEGTFGLKRGFKLAGVEQMIVSLWSVPDKETKELMSFFYSDLVKTLNPVASFDKAQRDMRKKYPTEPDKWAGFVLVR